MATFQNETFKIPHARIHGSGRRTSQELLGHSDIAW